MLQLMKQLFSFAPQGPLIGMNFTIGEPSVHASRCDALARMVRHLKLTGWMQNTNPLYIELEVYGPSQVITELIRQMDHGSIFNRSPKYEMKRLPYRSNYSTFHYAAFDARTARRS